MKSAELKSQEQRIRALIAKSSSFVASGDLELMAHWGRYLCILVAGFMENAYGEVYGAFVRLPGGNPRVGRYAAAKIEAIQNPKSSKFVETATAFDPAWGTALSAFLDQDGRKDAIDSIMANRHEIAHGGTVNITVARVQEYFGKCIDVVSFIEQQCGL